MKKGGYLNKRREVYYKNKVKARKPIYKIEDPIQVSYSSLLKTLWNSFKTNKLMKVIKEIKLLLVAITLNLTTMKLLGIDLEVIYSDINLIIIIIAIFSTYMWRRAVLSFVDLIANLINNQDEKTH